MTKKALIVGINAYPTAPLEGCVNDANDWNSTLRAKGFTCSVLLDSLATKAGILSGLNWLKSGAVSGDSLVFCFSGHGSQAPDQNGDEADFLDEVLCPVDWPQYIRDDDLKAIFDTLPSGVTLDVFSGACFSGTSTRVSLPAGKTARKIGASRSIPYTGKITKIKSRIVTVVPNLNHSLWTACKDTQTASEVTINGIPRGLFDYYAAKAIRTYSTSSRASLISAVQTSVQKVIPNQNPQLECKQSESTQRPFT